MKKLSISEYLKIKTKTRELTPDELEDRLGLKKRHRTAESI